MPKPFNFHVFTISKRFSILPHCRWIFSFRVFTISKRFSILPHCRWISPLTNSFDFLSFQDIPRILRKHFISNASIHFSNFLLRVHVSHPYNAIDVMIARRRFTLISIGSFLTVQILSNLDNALVALSILDSTSTLDVSSSVIVEPRYLKLLTLF